MAVGMGVGLEGCPQRSGSLLIVEDERVLSTCLKRHFSSLGMDVTVAGSVAEGRGCLERERFDACLLDVGLPDGDGLSLIGPASVDRSIVITATPDRERLAAAGIRFVHPKPLDLEVITRMLFELGLGGERALGRPPRPSVGAQRGPSPALRDPDATRPLRVMLYSHDTVGLGHFRRNLTIACALTSVQPRPHVLMVSGATEAVRFPKPSGVDLITLPALAKVDQSRYSARTLGVSLEEIVAIRSQTIRAAAASFRPDVLIVDNVPRGAERELDATLDHLRAGSTTRIVLGLRDVLDEPQAVARDWSRLENEAAIERYFDAIWVYGDPSVVELGVEYGFSAAVRRKLRYVGYLDRKRGRDAESASASPQRAREAGSPVPRRPFVLCLVGGGEDGDRVAEAFSRIPSEQCRGLSRVLLLGPFMPEAARAELHRRAEADPALEVLDFAEDPTALLEASQAVVSMGGHNSISEILSFDKPALIVPRVTPRREQWIRAHRLAALGIVDVCEPEELSPERLADWIEKGALRPRSRSARVDMGGAERVRTLLLGLANGSDEETRESRP